MSFSSGFQTGSEFVDSIQAQKRQKVLDDRATEQYGQQQEAYKRQLGIQAETDSARQSIKALDGGVFDGSKANFGINEGVAPDGPMPAQAYQSPAVGLQARKGTDTEYNQAFQREALARGDMAGMQTLRTAGKTIQFDDDYKKYVAEYKGDEAQIGETLSSVNGTSSRLTVGTPDKNGVARMSIVNGDKRAEFIKLSRQDQAVLYAGNRLLESDPARALALIAGVNKNLAIAVAEENNLVYKAGKENSDNAKDQGLLDIQRQQLADNKADRQEGRAIQRAGLAQRGEGSGKTLDPKYVAQLNDIAQRASEETDPAKRATLDRDYQRVQSTAYTSVGKVAPLRDQRAARPDFNPKEYAATIQSLTASGATMPEARMQADSLYGRAPQDSQVDASLQGLNKAKAQDKKPVVVRPGENGMRSSGQAIVGDPRDFQRVSSRGILGGLNYEYIDPVTKRRYSTEQFNALLGE